LGPGGVGMNKKERQAALSAELEPGLAAIRNHPITRVYVDDQALVCYERYEAEPVYLNMVSPLQSRRAAKERAEAVLDCAPTFEGMEVWDVPISETTGRGLTYRQLVMQTRAAIERSYELEKQLKDRELKKAKKYGLV
jgi:hypothetical protein